MRAPAHRLYRLAPRSHLPPQTSPRIDTQAAAAPKSSTVDRSEEVFQASTRRPSVRVPDLQAAADWLLQQQQQARRGGRRCRRSIWRGCLHWPMSTSLCVAATLVHAIIFLFGPSFTELVCARGSSRLGDRRPSQASIGGVGGLRLLSRLPWKLFVAAIPLPMAGVAKPCKRRVSLEAARRAAGRPQRTARGRCPPRDQPPSPGSPPTPAPAPVSRLRPTSPLSTAAALVSEWDHEGGRRRRRTVEGGLVLVGAEVQLRPLRHARHLRLDRRRQRPIAHRKVLWSNDGAAALGDELGDVEGAARELLPRAHRDAQRQHRLRPVPAHAAAAQLARSVAAAS